MFYRAFRPASVADRPLPTALLRAIGLMPDKIDLLQDKVDIV